MHILKVYTALGRYFMFEILVNERSSSLPLGLPAHIIKTYFVMSILRCTSLFIIAGGRGQLDPIEPA